MNRTHWNHIGHHGEERARIERATEQKQPVKSEGIFAVLKIHGEVDDETVDEPIPERVADCDNPDPILQPRGFFHLFLGIWEHQRLHVH